MPKRAYLIGDVYGSYRARALIEFLGSSHEFAYSYTDARYLTSYKKTLVRKTLLKGARIIGSLDKLLKFMIADLIYILPMCYLNWVECLLAKVLSKKVVTDFYISQYDTCVNDRKIVQSNTRKAKKYLSIDQRLIDVSAELIFLNNAERKYYLKIAGREERKKNINIIPLATMPKKKAALPYINNKSAFLTLCWWGTFIPLHGLGKIIDAAEILKTNNISFKMYLFGTSHDLSTPYKSLVHEKQLNNIVFIYNNKTFSDNSLEDFLANHCDIAFGNFGDSVKAKTVIVNKIVEAVSMGIPVISQRTLGLTEYFADKESIVYAKATPAGIAEKIMEVMKEKKQLLNISRQSYEVYKSNFSKESYIRRIKNVLSTN